MSERSPRQRRREELLTQLDEARAQFEATSAKIEAKAGRNLFVAIATGLLLGGVFLASLFIAPPAFMVFAGLLAILGVIELATAFRGAGRMVSRIAGAIGAVIIVGGAAFWGPQGMLLGLFIAATVLIVWTLIEHGLTRHTQPGRRLARNLQSGVFALIYVPFLTSFAVLLVAAPRGQWWVLAIVVTVVSVDVGAFAAGVTMGRHKMTPRISPNKTWEGFAGAGVLAILAGVLLSVLALHQPWWVGVVLGLVILLTATTGDLTESLIKRNLGVKDMSSWIPGHGGFLDRLDSLLPSMLGGYGVALALGVFG